MLSDYQLCESGRDIKRAFESGLRPLPVSERHLNLLPWKFGISVHAEVSCCCFDAGNSYSDVHIFGFMSILTFCRFSWPGFSHLVHPSLIFGSPYICPGSAPPHSPFLPVWTGSIAGKWMGVHLWAQPGFWFHSVRLDASPPTVALSLLSWSRVGSNQPMHLDALHLPSRSGGRGIPLYVGGQ